MADNVIQLIIEGNNVTAVKAIDGTTTKLNELGNKTSGVGGMVDSVFGSMQAKLTLAAGAAVTAFGIMIKGAIDSADEINKMSQKVGVGVEQLSTLKYAAELSDVSVEELGSSLAKLNRNVNDAATGTGEARNTLKALSIEAVDANGKIKDTDELLFEISDKFRFLPDGVQKSAYAMDLFGRSGANLIPFLNQGTDGIQRLQDEARALGLEIDTNTSQQAERLNDSILRLERSISGIANQTLPGLVDSLADITDGIYAANQAAENADSFWEFMVNLHSNAMIEGIKKGEQFQKDSYTEAISYAAKIAQEKMVGLTNAEVQGLVSSVTSRIAALKKLEPDEDLTNTIQQLEAQLGIYQKRFELTEKQKKELEKISNLESQLKFKIETAGLSEAALKVAQLRKEIDGLRQQGLSENLLSDYFYSQTDFLRNMDAQKSFTPKLPGMELKPETDTTGITSAMDIALSSFENISTESQLHFELMQGYAADAFGAMGDSMMRFYQLSGSKSREMFVLYKAFAVGQALMNTYEGATKAIAQGGIFGPVMAAAVIASGLANVAQIVSQQPTTSRGGSPSYGYTPRVPNYNSYNNSNVTNNTSKNQNININITTNGNGDVDKYVRDELAPALKKAISDGVIDL